MASKKTKRIIETALAEYLGGDEESPINGARYWLTYDLQFENGLTPRKALKAIDDIYWTVQKMSLDDCVAVCRAHGVEL